MKRRNIVAALAANTVQIRTDGLPPLRSTEQQESEYSRGGGGRDAGLGPLWPPVRAHHHLSSPYLNGIVPCGRQVLTPQLLMDFTSSRPVRERDHRKWQHTLTPLTAIASTLTTRKTWLKWRACLGKITTSPKGWVGSYPSGLIFPASTASLTLPAALEVPFVSRKASGGT